MEQIEGLFVVVTCFSENDQDFSVMGPYSYEEAVDVLHKQVEEDHQFAATDSAAEYTKIAKLTFLD